MDKKTAVNESKELIKEIIQMYKDNIPGNRQSRFARHDYDFLIRIFDEIPLTQWKDAGIKYVQGVGDDEEVILHYDDTLKGTGKNGLILTTKYPYWKSVAEGEECVSIFDIDDLFIKGGEFIVNLMIRLNNGITKAFQITKIVNDEEKERFARLLQEIIQLLIEKSPVTSHEEKKEGWKSSQEGLEEEIRAVFKRNYIQKTLLFGDIPLEKLQNTRRKYVGNLEFTEKAILHYDDKFPFYPYTGLLLTNTHLRWRGWKSWKSFWPKADGVDISFDFDQVSVQCGWLYSSLIVHTTREDKPIIFLRMQLNKGQIESFAELLNLTIKLLKNQRGSL